jgi:hypothetical protein
MKGTYCGFTESASTPRPIRLTLQGYLQIAACADNE